MNKQIEEMAKDIRISETNYLVAMVTADIDDAIDGVVSRDVRIATALYEKGYRKQTVGEWIEHIEKPSWLEDDVEVFYNCSVCGTSHWSITPPFCPNCGAKMKNESEGADGNIGG